MLQFDRLFPSCVHTDRNLADAWIESFPFEHKVRNWCLVGRCKWHSSFGLDVPIEFAVHFKQVHICMELLLGTCRCVDLWNPSTLGQIADVDL